jgi:hypothetical protein
MSRASSILAGSAIGLFNIMICEFCSKKYKKLWKHIKHCKLNPDRVKGFVPDIPWNKGIEYVSLKSRKPDIEVFVENSNYARHALKKRIIKDKKIEYLCDICGIGPIWNGKPMPLILDHINGKNNDNRVSNLRFVCSNCDSQLPTYKSKNRKHNPMDGDGSGLENRRV